MTKRLLIVGSLAAVVASGAHAASFACAKATRPVEKLICGDKNLSALDERLAQAYRAGLGKLPAAAAGLLRADQVQWLAWMQEICGAPMPTGFDASAGPATSSAAVVECMVRQYDRRVNQLRSIAMERDGTRFLVRTQYLASPEEKASPDVPGFGTLEANWPVTLSDSPEWTAWNNAVEATMYKLATSDIGGEAVVTVGTPAVESPRWTPDLAKGADTELWAHLERVEHGRVTAVFSMGTTAHGAAHPNTVSATVTWLLQPKRSLRANDVFLPGDSWKDAVAQACWNAIHTGEQKDYVYPEVTSPHAKELQEVISDVSNWTLEHDGLHISYPEYSIAPRMAPIDDTVIPWSALQPMLAKGFITP